MSEATGEARVALVEGTLGDTPLDQLAEIAPRPRVRERPGRIRPQRRRPRPGPCPRQQHRQPQQHHPVPARPLAEPKPDTAAAAYYNAVRQEVASAFAGGGEGDYLKTEPLPTSPEDFGQFGAKAAAICVLEAFIEHALRLDGCPTTLRRPSTNTGSFKAVS